MLAFPVSDLHQTRDFYERALGLSRLATGPDWTDYELGGLRPRTYVHNGPYQRQHSGLSFFVDDVDATVAELRNRGVVFRGELRDEPWGGRMITVADPDANLFDLLDNAYAATLAEAN